MTEMTIIVVAVLFVSLMVFGMLVGMSMHREATRLRRKHLQRDERAFTLLRGLDDARRRAVDDHARRRVDETWV